jgi:hypothetical protein
MKLPLTTGASFFAIMHHAPLAVPMASAKVRSVRFLLDPHTCARYAEELTNLAAKGRRPICFDLQKNLITYTDY